MQPSTRIIVNTLAQYGRTIINLILSLYSSRLVLNILGVNDFGIYSLVAGVVSMLSFITNSLVGSTQRFLSVAQGKGDKEELKSIFSNSVIVHLALGLIVALILEACTPLLFNGFLNIPSGRENAAASIYQMVIIMVYISFIASPYRALLVSRENIVYTSIIDVVDGILKVVLVFLLKFIGHDKLLAYGCVMLSISLFNLMAFTVYSHRKYEECIFPKIKLFTLNFLKRLFSYTGWVIYSTLCITLRTQGLAVVLNRAMGTVVNAAYGIGAQISGMLSNVSTSFSNAISPQLMAAEGRHDRQRMWLLAGLQSKYSFLLLSMLGIPVLFEMPALLKIWLGNVPEHAVLFGRMFLLMQIIDMLTTGLGIANRAIGKIGLYTVVTFTPKLLILPVSWFLLRIGLPLFYVCLVMVMIEFLSMLLRIPLSLKEEGFNAADFSREVFLKTLPPVIVSTVVCVIIFLAFESCYRWIITFAISTPIFMLTTYKTSLEEREQRFIQNIFHLVSNKHKKSL